MADIFISWTEIEYGEFPDCCMTCGADGTTLVPRLLETYHIGFMCRIRKFIMAELPFCNAHRSRPWIRLGRTDVRSFADDGVWMKNVSPVFVEEMEIFRDAEDDYEEKRHRRKHKKRRRRDDDDDDREPFADRPSEPRRPASASIAGYVILGVVAVPVLAVGLCCVGGIILAQFGGVQPNPNPQPGPAFHQPPGPKPPFGPNRPPKRGF